MSPSRWANIRAIVLAIVLLGHGIYALPIPEPISTTDVKNPQRQRDIEVWRGLLRSLGLDIPLERVEGALVSTTKGLSKIHRTLKAPFKPAFELVGANQSWALFASASTTPDRLVVQIDRGNGWETVMRRLDPCCSWREDQLEYRRLRGVWDGQQRSMRAGYKGLTKWIARQAMRDAPDAQKVRVYLERSVSVYPWEPPDDSKDIVHERTHRRSDLEAP